MTKEKFDIKALEELDITQVLDALGVEKKGSKYLCPNNHEKLTKIATYGTICKCHNCDSYKGNSIAIAKWHFKEDFVEACKWLHDTFNIPMLNGDNSTYVPKYKPFQSKIIETKYQLFDKNKRFVKVGFDSCLVAYERMDERQRFMTIVTAIHRFSMQTKQKGKYGYYKSIGISAKTNPMLRDKINLIDNHVGWLYKTDIPTLVGYLSETFPLDDLVLFGVLNGVDSKAPFSFKHQTDGGFCVIPSYDLYSNMVTGLKLRNTKLFKWQDSGMKEPELSYHRIANPLPYLITRESFLNTSLKFRFFEGQKDLHSIPFKDGFVDAAIPGVNGLKKEQLGLFKGRVVEIWFDQDNRGKEGAKLLKAALLEAGALEVSIKIWSISIGSDVNEVLQNGNILKIQQGK